MSAAQSFSEQETRPAEVTTVALWVQYDEVSTGDVFIN